VTTTVVVDPDHGAALRAFYDESVGGRRDWLAPSNAEHVACFFMVPFCSRVRHGRFSFAGVDVRLPANNPPDVHAIHGHGFQNPWQVLGRTGSSVALEYMHFEDQWPWRYRARVLLALHATGLRIELSVRNEADRVMPSGLGIHPYFSKASGTRVRASVGTWLELDDRLLPLGIRPVPEHLDPGRGLELGDRVFDHVFCDWSGEAHIAWPDGDGLRLLRLGAGVPNHLVLWAPRASDFFCLEPVSNLPDGFNLDAGIRGRFVEVAPGENYRESWLLAPVRA